MCPRPASSCPPPAARLPSATHGIVTCGAVQLGSCATPGLLLAVLLLAALLEGAWAFLGRARLGICGSAPLPHPAGVVFVGRRRGRGCPGLGLTAASGVFLLPPSSWRLGNISCSWGCGSGVTPARSWCPWAPPAPFSSSPPRSKGTAWPCASLPNPLLVPAAGSKTSSPLGTGPTTTSTCLREGQPYSQKIGWGGAAEGEAECGGPEERPSTGVEAGNWEYWG